MKVGLGLGNTDGPQQMGPNGERKCGPGHFKKRKRKRNTANQNKKNKWCKIVKACIWCSREEEGILKKEENNAAVPIHWSKSMYRIGYFSLIH